MAIRSAWLDKALVKFTVSVGKRWFGTLRVQIVRAHPHDDPRERPTSSILSVWHEDLMVGCLAFAPHGLQVLVSQSREGNAITRTIEGLGFSAIRGSSKRGGVQAMRHMLKQIGTTNLAITPDGPKGPRQQVKEGITYLASRSGAPIVPMGLAYNCAYRFRTWDRLAWALPWSRIVIYLMPALHIPPGADKDSLGQYTAQLQTSMQEATRRARQCLQQRRSYFSNACEVSLNHASNLRGGMS